VSTPPAPDLGGQHARTLLSWRRTALSLVAASALVSHFAVDRTDDLVVALTLAFLGVVVAFCWLSPRRQVAAAGVALVTGVVVLGGLAVLTVVGG
jgi:hypothetical protein